MVRTIIYTRTSFAKKKSKNKNEKTPEPIEGEKDKDKEDEYETSSQTQIDEVIARLKQDPDKSRYPPVAILKDEDVYSDTWPKDRKVFPQILAMAERKEFDELWVYSRDRIGREENVVGFIRGSLAQFGVKIIALDDDSNHHFSAIKDVFGAMELEKYRGKRLAGVERAIREGKTLFKPPYGYRSGKDTDHKLMIDETKRGIVIALFKEFENPVMSIKKLAVKYQLKPSTIQGIRSNPIYKTGEVHYRGEIIYYVEPILPKMKLSDCLFCEGTGQVEITSKDGAQKQVHVCPACKGAKDQSELMRRIEERGA